MLQGHGHPLKMDKSTILQRTIDFLQKQKGTGGAGPAASFHQKRQIPSISGATQRGQEPEWGAELGTAVGLRMVRAEYIADQLNTGRFEKMQCCAPFTVATLPSLASASPGLLCALSNRKAEEQHPLQKSGERVFCAIFPGLLDWEMINLSCCLGTHKSSLWNSSRVERNSSRIADTLCSQEYSTTLKLAHWS